ncbi:MAG: hypothetical protein QNJ98_13820 [Planctomycetota bacterium]|nr:hypothetical protein [Planctomycetota bacterium]
MQNPARIAWILVPVLTLAVGWVAWTGLPTGDSEPEARAPAPPTTAITRKQARHRDRAAWARRILQDNEGRLPANLYAHGKAEYEKIARRSLQKGLTIGGWEELGPERIGGRVRALAVGPAETPRGPSTLWAGGVAGGVWKSTNRGATWEPKTDFLSNIAISSIVIDPTDANRMWIGTGESFVSPGAQLGAGVFQSTDRGETWTQLPITATWAYVNRLSISADGNTLLAAVDGGHLGDGIYRSTNDGSSWTFQVAGIFGDVDFHPTDPTRAIAGITGFGYVKADGTTINLPLAPLYYYSSITNSWTPATGLPLTIPSANTFELNDNNEWTRSRVSRVETAWALDGSDVAFASVWVRGQFSNGSEARRTGGLLRTENGGASYDFVNRPAEEPGGRIGNGAAFLGDQGDYDNALWVGIAPDDEDLPVVVGGVELYRSLDGGSILTRITDSKQDPESGGKSVHADHHAIVADRTYDGVNRNQVYFANDGGIYYTPSVRTAGNDPPDYKNAWQRINGNLRITQFYTGDGARTEGVQRWMGGTQDNGTLYFRDTNSVLDRNRDWFTVGSGDGGGCAIDPRDARWIFGSIQRGELYASGVADTATTLAGFQTNTNLDGADYKYPLDQLNNKPAPYLIEDIQQQKAPFIVRGVALDRTDPETLYVGIHKLWRTEEVRRAPTGDLNGGTGPVWNDIKDALPDLPNGERNYISVVKVDRNDQSRIWVGHDGGQLFVQFSLTGQPNFGEVGPFVELRHLSNNALIDANAPWPTRALTGIAINRNDSNHICVCFGGMQEGNLWQTFDAGNTWYRGENMPAVAAFDVEIHPDRPETIYLATEVGVFTSYDGGVTWSTSPDGPRAVRVTDLTWIGKRLYAATFGRGVFRQTLLYAGPPLMRWDVRDRFLVRGQTELFSFTPRLVSEPPGGDPSLSDLGTFVWSNQRSAKPGASIKSPLEIEMDGTDLGTTSLGRIYLTLVEAKDASGAKGWHATSAVVPADARVSTLLGLVVKATKDEMELAKNGPDAAKTAGQKSGGGDQGVPTGYDFQDRTN